MEVPPDIEAILGLEQLDQLQDLAGKAPVHLESLPQARIQEPVLP